MGGLVRSWCNAVTGGGGDFVCVVHVAAQLPMSHITLSCRAASSIRPTSLRLMHWWKRKSSAVRRQRRAPGENPVQVVGKTSCWTLLRGELIPNCQAIRDKDLILQGCR